ncbi:MAG: M20 family metallopeptidase [Candidatus Aminicenantales bacterium]
MDFRRYFRSRQGEMVNMLKKAVALESPTADKKAVDACSAFWLQEFKKTGAALTRYAQKDIGDLHLVEYAPGGLKKEPERILILTHVDTVWPVGTSRKMPFYVSEEKIYGPGALDMKAGLVMAVFALCTLRELNITPSKRIAVLLNSAEETGHEAGRKAVQEASRKSSLVLCLEPALPGGALKMERKGRLVIRLDASGKAAHAGTPEKGVSAVEELIGQLGRLKKLRSGETTVNIGRVRGGEKINVVPEAAEAVLDIRFWKNSDKEKIRAYFKDLEPSLQGAKIKAVIESVSPPMEWTRASAGLFAQAREIAAGMGLELASGRTGGGSDASIASSLGLPTLDGLGPDGDGIHAEREHVLLSSLADRTALLTELLARL